MIKKWSFKTDKQIFSFKNDKTFELAFNGAFHEQTKVIAKTKLINLQKKIL